MRAPIVLRLSLTAAALAASLLVGRPGIGVAAPTPLASALTAWSAFPVADAPRPIVLPSEPGTVLAPPAGFPSGTAKLAFLEGAVRLTVSLPAPPRPQGYPLTTASAALRELETGSSRAKVRAPALSITAIRLGSAEFSTDRGTVALPAWLFNFAGVTSPAAVLAVAPPRAFRAPPSIDKGAELFVRASISAGGRSLTVTFVGAPPGNGPCSPTYEVLEQSSNAAVAVQLSTVRSSAPPTSVICGLIGYMQTKVVHLTAPLGNRVIVDAASDEVIPVLSSSTT